MKPIMASRLIDCPVCGSNEFELLFEVEGNRGVPFIDAKHRVVFCARCGICMLNPQHTIEDYRRFYETHNRAADVEMDVKTPRPQSLRTDYDRLRIDFLTHFIKDKNAKILDVGAGYGYFLYMIEKRGYKNVEGLEPSAEGVQVSEK